MSTQLAFTVKPVVAHHAIGIFLLCRSHSPLFNANLKLIPEAAIERECCGWFANISRKRSENFIRLSRSS